MEWPTEPEYPSPRLLIGQWCVKDHTVYGTCVMLHVAQTQCMSLQLRKTLET